MALKGLGGDDGITMHRHESRDGRKSRDCGVVRRGQVGGEK
jgi:hypothetical protein